jgi:hypothetical protein
MPQGMAAKVWQQHGVFSILFKLAIIAVPYNAAQGFIQCSLVLAVPKTVDKDKICIPVHFLLTSNPVIFLVLPFPYKRLLHIILHWNLSSASFFLGVFMLK